MVVEVDPNLQGLLVVVLSLLELPLLLGNPTQLVQGSCLSLFHCEVDPNLQGLLVVVLSLLELPLLLGNPAQVVQGTGLRVLVVEVDFDLQGLLVVVLSLLELPLLLGNHTQLMIDGCTSLSHCVGIIIRVLKAKSECFLIGCFCICIVLEMKVPSSNGIDSTNDFRTKRTCS